MAYSKQTWLDRIVQFPMRFLDQNSNVLSLTDLPGEVAQEGTIVSADRMNHMEEGIATNDATATTALQTGNAAYALANPAYSLAKNATPAFFGQNLRFAVSSRIGANDADTWFEWGAADTFSRYVVDRWRLTKERATEAGGLVTKEVSAPGGGLFIRWYGSGDAYNLLQVLETPYSSLNGKTVAVTVECTGPQYIGAVVMHHPGQLTFLSRVSAFDTAASCTFVGTIPSSPNVTSLPFTVHMQGWDGVIVIKGIFPHIGDTPGIAGPIDIGQDSIACQRYYTILPQGLPALYTPAGIMVEFPAGNMRVNPTLVYEAGQSGITILDDSGWPFALPLTVIYRFQNSIRMQFSQPAGATLTAGKTYWTYGYGALDAEL